MTRRPLSVLVRLSLGALLLAPLSSHAFMLLVLMHVAQTVDKERVVELDRLRDWPGLVALADERLGGRDGDVLWLAVKGYGLQRQHRCAEAVPVLEKAGELEPESTWTRHLMARCHAEIGDHARAIAAFGEVLRQDPGHVLAGASLVRLHARRDDEPAARRSLEALRQRYGGLAARLEQSELAPMLARLDRRR